jgi:uncharacterized cupin superfamily protein
MIDEQGGWFKVNVRDAPWYKNESFGKIANFEGENRFPATGIRLWVVEPGMANCRYHRESAQEDFLVLSGECLLLVNGEEQKLKAWDFVHCPAGVSHVFIGDGDGPCSILAIGDRPEKNELCYPESELARKHGAETPEPTPDPKVAYANAPQWEKGEFPDDPSFPFSS